MTEPKPSQPTKPRLVLDMDFLSIPDPEKNFLLSPPGSPPIGWKQTKEEASKGGVLDVYDFEDQGNQRKLLFQGTFQGVELPTITIPLPEPIQTEPRDSIKNNTNSSPIIDYLKPKQECYVPTRLPK